MRRETLPGELQVVDAGVHRHHENHSVFVDGTVANVEQLGIQTCARVCKEPGRLETALMSGCVCGNLFCHSVILHNLAQHQREKTKHNCAMASVMGFGHKYTCMSMFYERHK